MLKEKNNKNMLLNCVDVTCENIKDTSFSV